MVWRNRLTHVHSDNRLAQEVVASLRAAEGSIAEDYQGLAVTEMLQRIQDGAPPRLKEATALIRASGVLTRSLDQLICGQADIAGYLNDVLRQHLEPREHRKARATGIWGGTPTQNTRSILNVAAQAGMRMDASDPIDSELPLLTPRKAVAHLGITWG
jgi:hypothetical protein